MAQPDYVAMGQIADDLKTRFTTARGLGRTTGDILQAFLLTKGLNAVSKAVGSTAKATTLTGDAALSAEAGAKTAISTWSSRYTQAGETFYHYGYAEQAASFSRGLRARSYATTEGGLTGAEATSRLALGQALSPDAVYVVTPKPGTFIWTNPVTSPKYGRPGGLPEIFFPIGTGPGTVSGPFPIP